MSRQHIEGLMSSNTHPPDKNDRRPHVPIETISIGEVFRRIEEGDIQDEAILKRERLPFMDPANKGVDITKREP